MTIQLGSPEHVARAVADYLDRHRIPYAPGGALTYNFHGALRATADVDFNVFASS